MKKQVVDTVKTVSAILLLGVLLATFIFTPVWVNGASMYPTLHDGDAILLWEILYEPSLFDKVVFEYEPDNFFVKRIIGVPGMHVKYADDQLYLDGVSVESPFIETARETVAIDERFRWDFESGNFTEDFELQAICDINGFEDCDVIPEGWLLVLGDNRPRSRDSRHIGLVRQEAILGSTRWIQWPISRVGAIE